MLEVGLARGEGPREVAVAPGVGDGPGGGLGSGRGKLLDVTARHRFAFRPVGDLVHLGREGGKVVPDDLDERPCRTLVGLNARALEARPHPGRQVARLRRLVRQHLAGPGDGLRELRTAKLLLGDEREHGARSGLAQVGLDRSDVLGLPTLDVLDDDEPPVVAAEEAERVAGRHRLLAGGRLGRERLDGLGAEAGAQAPERKADLGPVAAGEEVHGLETLLRHRGEHSRRSVSARPAP